MLVSYFAYAKRVTVNKAECFTHCLKQFFFLTFAKSSLLSFHYERTRIMGGEKHRLCFLVIT